MRRWSVLDVDGGRSEDFLSLLDLELHYQSFTKEVSL